MLNMHNFINIIDMYNIKHLYEILFCVIALVIILSSDISTDDGLRNITIRGVDIEIYEAFTSKLRDYNMNVGDAFNKMIEDVLVNFDKIFNEMSIYDFVEQQRYLPRISIDSHDELTISADDLKTTKSRVSFRSVGQLVFDDSVTKEIFLLHVKEIYRCSTVKFSKDFPKLIALAYCNDCDNVEFH